MGTGLISAAIDSISSGLVKSVSGELGLKNLQAYNELMSVSGMTPEQAAMNTPLGKLMQQLGYKSVVVDTSSNMRVFVKYGK